MLSGQTANLGWDWGRVGWSVNSFPISFILNLLYFLDTEINSLLPTNELGAADKWMMVTIIHLSPGFTQPAV